jgi:hypothetical protein
MFCGKVRIEIGPPGRYAEKRRGKAPAPGGSRLIGATTAILTPFWISFSIENEF